MKTVRAPQHHVYQNENDKLPFIPAHGAEFLPRVLKALRIAQRVDFQRKQPEQNEPYAGNEHERHRDADGRPLEIVYFHARHIPQELHGQNIHGRARGCGNAAHEHADGKADHERFGEVAAHHPAPVLLHHFKRHGSQHHHHRNIGHES